MLHTMKGKAVSESRSHITKCNFQINMINIKHVKLNESFQVLKTAHQIKMLALKNIKLEIIHLMIVTVD